MPSDPSCVSVTPRLLADVGGTNARFAWQSAPGAGAESVRVLPCASFATLQDAISAYLQDLGRPLPAAAGIAIANPVHGDRVQMTNHHWSFSIEALRKAMGWCHLKVVNDFTALALALPGLPDAARKQVGGSSTPAAAAPMALLGPGTGLGVSGLIPDGDGRWLPLAGEGGHVTLVPQTEREWRVCQHLSDRFGHASAERAISGQGLVNVYRALSDLDGLAVQAHTPADITTLALSRQCPVCVEALRMMCALLGSVAGNLALTLGARGGVYLGGGIVPRLGEWFAQTDFRRRFEAKGRFQAYLTDVPVWVIHAQDSPALQGAGVALDMALARGR